MLHLITCHRRIMPHLAKLLFNNMLNPEPDAAGRILTNTLNTEPYAE